jgi:hypothetical protein
MREADMVLQSLKCSLTGRRARCARRPRSTTLTSEPACCWLDDGDEQPPVLAELGERKKVAIECFIYVAAVAQGWRSRRGAGGGGA